MKEKIKFFLKKEFHIPIPKFLKESRFNSIFEDFPKMSELKVAIKTFSSKEKILFFIISGIFIVTSTYILWDINQSFMIERPIKGGEMVEGIADIPRFINPLLATGEADRDMSQLVYSGLLRAGDNGKYLNDLAENYNVDEKGLTYTFTIKESATWHDGKPVTADDVLFSVQKAKDPILRSPKRASWEGVTATKIDSKTVQFILKQPYQSFLENLTMGIIPKHKWDNIDSDNFVHSELNRKGAVGSGPYKIKTFYKNLSTGDPEYIELIPFKKFVLGEPKISKLIIRFYPNQEKLFEAYQNGNITSINAISPEFIEEIENNNNIILKSNLPRILAVFFNQTESKVLANKNVRIALDKAIDKKNIIDKVLFGYGSLIDSPVPPGTFLVRENNINLKASTTEDITEEAKKILSKDGWKLNEKSGLLEKKISKTETQKLEISLSTIDFSELKKAAELIKADWEKIGVRVDLKIFEKGDLDRNVIEPRKYDALFFGEIVGRDLDLFSFWHSSQKKNPGVNVSLYSNTKVDKILETLKAEKNDSKKNVLIQDFKKEIEKDVPASFIYSPSFVYVVPREIKNVHIIPPITSSDRFLNIHEWYIKTEKVWKIFE